MSADIPAAAGATRTFGIDAPASLLLAGGFQLGREPALNVKTIDPADVSQQTTLDNVATEAGGPVAEVGVSHRKGYPEFAGGFHQFVGFLEIEAKRLFAKHRDAGLHRLHCWIEVHEVGRDDEDVVELLVVWQGRVGGDHLIVGRIALDRIGPVGSFLERDRGIRG